MELESPNLAKAAANITRTSLGTGRVETFSDAVMAIAITLLVLEFKVPQSSQTGSPMLAEELIKLWPEFGSYIISFLVIGLIWINHHQMFKLLNRTSHYFLVLNLFFLMAIAFVPFPTALLAEYLREGHEQQVATSVYTGSMLIMLILSASLWFYTFHNQYLMVPGVRPEPVKSILNKYIVWVLVGGVAFGMSFVFYQLSLVIFVFLQLFSLLPGGFELDIVLPE